MGSSYFTVHNLRVRGDTMEALAYHNSVRACVCVRCVSDFVCMCDSVCVCPGPASWKQLCRAVLSQDLAVIQSWVMEVCQPWGSVYTGSLGTRDLTHHETHGLRRAKCQRTSLLLYEARGQCACVWCMRCVELNLQRHAHTYTLSHKCTVQIPTSCTKQT